MLIQRQKEINGNGVVPIVYICIQSGTADLATFIAKNHGGNVNDKNKNS